VHGYQAKFGPEKNPHPPDDTVLAQIRALGPVWEIVRTIEDMMAENPRPFGSHYGWWMTVLLNRMHHIRPEELKARRAELRLAPTRGKTLSGEQQQFPAPVPPPPAVPIPPDAEPDGVPAFVPPPPEPAPEPVAPPVSPLEALLKAEDDRAFEVVTKKRRAAKAETSAPPSNPPEKREVPAAAAPAVDHHEHPGYDEREASRRATEAAVRAARKAEIEQRRLQMQQVMRGVG
jgi:hypothetical protein